MEGDVVDDDWIEPFDAYNTSGDGREVRSVVDFLPRLLERKYGSTWQESLMGQLTPEELKEIERLDAEEAVGPSFQDIIHHEEEEGDEALVGYSEEELQRLVAAMPEDEIEGDLDEEIEEPELGLSEFEEAELLEHPEDASEQLARYMLDKDGGLVEPPPKPFPESEWYHVFACAATEKRYNEMSSTWANLRVLIHVNFDDLELPLEEGTELDCQQRAMLIAKLVHAATGLPAIACVASLTVLAEGTKPQSETLFKMDQSVEELISRLRPNSKANRVCAFQAGGAFYDGKQEAQGYGEFMMPIDWAQLHHHTVALSGALDQLFINVCQTLDLRFVGSDDFDDFYKLSGLQKSGKLRKKTAGGLLLREKLLREATVLDASILKVSSFLNHQVDVALIEACGEELAERIEDLQPTKVLTVEATGLLPALFVGRALDIPVLYARKSRQIGISDAYTATYKSRTTSTENCLYVGTEYLLPGDRVVIIDDFLAGGATADALIRICRMASATTVSCCFLIEKVGDAGRAFLSGYQIPLEALACIEIIDGRVRIAGESTDEDEYYRGGGVDWDAELEQGKQRDAERLQAELDADQDTL